MKIIVEDNVILIETPSDDDFIITIRTDSIDVEGKRPMLREHDNTPNILTFKTLDPNKVRLSLQ